MDKYILKKELPWCTIWSIFYVCPITQYYCTDNKKRENYLHPDFLKSYPEYFEKIDWTYNVVNYEEIQKILDRNNLYIEQTVYYPDCECIDYVCIHRKWSWELLADWAWEISDDDFLSTLLDELASLLIK